MGIIWATTNIRYNRYCSNTTAFPKKIISQIIWHLLGDGSLVMTKTSVNPFFVFTQTLKRFEYTWSVFQSLSHYCGWLPFLNNSTRKGKSVPFTPVMTRNYPFLLSLYTLMYNNSTGKAVKTITSDIFPYLDEISLAYWAMDAGAAHGSLFP